MAIPPTGEETEAPEAKQLLAVDWSQLCDPTKSLCLSGPQCPHL